MPSRKSDPIHALWVKSFKKHNTSSKFLKNSPTVKINVQIMVINTWVESLKMNSKWKGTPPGGGGSTGYLRGWGLQVLVRFARPKACIGPPYSGLGPLVAPVLWARRWKCLGISKTQKRFRPKPKKIGSTKNIQKPTYRTSCLERAARKKGQCGNHPPHSKLLERAFGGKQGGEPLAVRFVAQVAGKALPNHSNWTANSEAGPVWGIAPPRCTWPASVIFSPGRVEGWIEEWDQIFEVELNLMNINGAREIAKKTR